MSNTKLTSDVVNVDLEALQALALTTDQLHVIRGGQTAGESARCIFTMLADVALVALIAKMLWRRNIAAYTQTKKVCTSIVAGLAAGAYGFATYELGNTVQNSFDDVRSIF